MKTIKPYLLILIVILILTILTGCSGQAQEVIKLKEAQAQDTVTTKTLTMDDIQLYGLTKGMTRQEVKDLLGPPLDEIVPGGSLDYPDFQVGMFGEGDTVDSIYPAEIRNIRAGSADQTLIDSFGPGEVHQDGVQAYHGEGYYSRWYQVDDMWVQFAVIDDAVKFIEIIL